MIPIMLLDSFAVFCLLALSPVDQVRAVAGAQQLTPAQVAEVRAQYHLNKPLLVQYWYWLKNVLHFDFGVSRQTGTSVVHELSTRIPITAGLVLFAAAFALVIAVPVGVVSGIRPGHSLDNAGRLAATLGLAIPNFVLAILLIYIFGVKLKWLPVLGYVPFTQSPLQWARHMVMPGVALGAVLGVYVMRQLRAGMIDTLDSSYVRAAWARGGRPRRVIGGHALKNGSLPALTVFSFAVAAILGGTAIIEEIFNIPGLGSFIVSAIITLDVPVIQAVTLLFVVTQLVIALLVDIAYGWLNPKIRVA
jgi:peptide/nickel transport system permease protein